MIPAPFTETRDLASKVVSCYLELIRRDRYTVSNPLVQSDNPGFQIGGCTIGEMC